MSSSERFLQILEYDESKTNAARPRAGRVVLAALAVLAAICIISAIDGYFRIAVNEYEIFNELLPDEFDGFRIVQISDLHSKRYGDGNIRLLDAVLEQSPDIIALTGDFIENADELPELGELATELLKIAPVYFVSGNHDWASGQIDAIAYLLDESGVRYLRNEYVELTVGSESIILAGVEDPNGYFDMKKPPEVVEDIRDRYPDSFVVLLGHRNYWPEKYPLLDVDVILCGHAHGGIIRVPFIGGLIGANFDLFPPYTSGAYEEARYTMVVSRGLGDTLPVPRIFNNVHLPVIVLRKGAN